MKSMIYTRTGDKGTTALIGGRRVSKHDPRLVAYGTVDELNSFLGFLGSEPQLPAEIAEMLPDVQSRLFDIGAILASDPDGDYKAPALAEADIERIEKAIDMLDGQLEPLRCFVLPAGCESATRAHLARAVCRRAEREIAALAETSPIDDTVLRYINRLSDYLFVAARYCNLAPSQSETPWKAWPSQPK